MKYPADKEMDLTQDTEAKKVYSGVGCDTRSTKRKMHRWKDANSNSSSRNEISKYYERKTKYRRRYGFREVFTRERVIF